MEYLRFQIWTCRSRGLDGVIDLFKFDKFEKLSEIPLHTRVLELRDKSNIVISRCAPHGSKIDGDVRLSVRILDEEIQYKILCKKLKPLNIVFQVELAALREAVDWAIENKKKIIIIYTDRYSIEALKNYGSRSKFVISIKNKFCKAEGLAGLPWVIVGIPGNELADRFAKLTSVETLSSVVVIAFAFQLYERGFDPRLAGICRFVTIYNLIVQKQFISPEEVTIHCPNDLSSTSTMSNGPYAPFGFESIEKQLWRNKQNDRPISDSEIKAVLSQLIKTDQWLPPEGHVSEDVTSHA
ncbi:hypothetical protein AVEN_85543-1 [Araneus ventricosus]|uniref:RNase H type-1 domain-containing protein n=1 Tax=Araneus ventricosus TaxID=182803 RepID=A0A4Y2LM84_ARAVE|nr:hypothetical protein AVEN_85543-1 [Araneus ventricosus]